jgi:hypothetical protein
MDIESCVNKVLYTVTAHYFCTNNFRFQIYFSMQKYNHTLLTAVLHNNWYMVTITTNLHLLKIIFGLLSEM